MIFGFNGNIIFGDGELNWTILKIVEILHALNSTYNWL